MPIRAAPLAQLPDQEVIAIMDPVEQAYARAYTFSLIYITCKRGGWSENKDNIEMPSNEGGS